MTNKEQSIQHKTYYMTLCCAGELSIRKTARELEVTPQTICVWKKVFPVKGRDTFIHGNTGKIPHNKKSKETESKIINYYIKSWSNAPFSTFTTALKEFQSFNICYATVRNIMKRNGIKSPRFYNKKEKPVHESRRERPHTGDLIQMDASKHDWFMTGQYENIHGAIDDATHKITGLYMTQNECRLGYNEVLRQTFQNYGIPQAVYIDRHSSFVSTPKKRKEKQQLTFQERIQKEKESETHFNDLCDKLNIQVILALSAQGKGRIERLWQTLQGILPFYFRYLNINTIEAANKFLEKWVPQFNERFSVEPRIIQSGFKKVPKCFNFDYDLSIKFHKRTDKDGCFTFHDFDFCIDADFKCCKTFVLCLSEQFGVKAYMDGKYYNVILLEPLVSVRGDHMPEVEKDLIARYLLQDLHTNNYAG